MHTGPKVTKNIERNKEAIEHEQIERLIKNYSM